MNGRIAHIFKRFNGLLKVGFNLKSTFSKIFDNSLIGTCTQIAYTFFSVVETLVVPFTHILDFVLSFFFGVKIGTVLFNSLINGHAQGYYDQQSERYVSEGTEPYSTNILKYLFSKFMLIACRCIFFKWDLFSNSVFCITNIIQVFKILIRCDLLGFEETDRTPYVFKLIVYTLTNIKKTNFVVYNFLFVLFITAQLNQLIYVVQYTNIFLKHVVTKFFLWAEYDFFKVYKAILYAKLGLASVLSVMLNRELSNIFFKLSHIYTFEKKRAVSMWVLDGLIFLNSIIFGLSSTILVNLFFTIFKINRLDKLGLSLLKINFFTVFELIFSSAYDFYNSFEPVSGFSTILFHSFLICNLFYCFKLKLALFLNDVSLFSTSRGPISTVLMGSRTLYDVIMEVLDKVIFSKIGKRVQLI